MTHRKIIGANIRVARLALGRSQERLAARAKLNSDYIITLERGLVNVSVDALVRIAKNLKSRLSNLVEGLDTKPKSSWPPHRVVAPPRKH